MLTAFLNGKKIEAAVAEQRGDFVCPGCNHEVILKKGRIRVAHFAHKSYANCDYAKGETPAHLEAKRLWCDELRSRGIKAEVEYSVGGNWADVMAWPSNGPAVAFEFQRCGIRLEEIEKRAFSYAEQGIAQIWIPFLKPSVLEKAEPVKNGNDGKWLIERFPARPFVRWVHGLHWGLGMWFYDPKGKVFWFGRMKGHKIPVEATEWGGGYDKWSKRWRELTLQGPYEPGRVKVRCKWREAWENVRYKWPACWIAEFVIGDASER